MDNIKSLLDNIKIIYERKENINKLILVNEAINNYNI